MQITSAPNDAFPFKGSHVPSIWARRHKVWQIDIHDEKDELALASAITMAVLRQKRPD